MGDAALLAGSRPRPPKFFFDSMAIHHDRSRPVRHAIERARTDGRVVDEMALRCANGCV